ncbi:MAG: MBL fold metallo-hydrolase [Acidimicrobiales bacterium]
MPTAGPETVRYGGNTSCVEVRSSDDDVVVLDAGTGIRRLGAALPPGTRRVDVLLTHLHMDHIQGLGFFDALFRPDVEVHIWGPPSTTLAMGRRLARYLSPPLFPVRMADLACRLELHDVPLGTFPVGALTVTAALVCHPGPTLGYRIEDRAGSIAYLPDHEPALGVDDFPGEPDWTSGFALADGVDLLIHDAQYSLAEYPSHVGWGHSAIDHAVAFAAATGVGRLVGFHHDPGHDDDALDALFDHGGELSTGSVSLTPGMEGDVFQVGSDGSGPVLVSGGRTA